MKSDLFAFIFYFSSFIRVNLFQFVIKDLCANHSFTYPTVYLNLGWLDQLFTIRCLRVPSIYVAWNSSFRECLYFLHILPLFISMVVFPIRCYLLNLSIWPYRFVPVLVCEVVLWTHSGLLCNFFRDFRFLLGFTGHLVIIQFLESYSSNLAPFSCRHEVACADLVGLRA